LAKRIVMCFLVVLFAVVVIVALFSPVEEKYWCDRCADWYYGQPCKVIYETVDMDLCPDCYKSFDEWWKE